MAHFNFVISQNAKWGMPPDDEIKICVPENILLQKSTAQAVAPPALLPLLHVTM